MGKPPGWDTATALARSKLSRNRKEITLAGEKWFTVDTCSAVAASLWLDELGQLFGCSPVGHIFQYYDVEDFEVLEAGLSEEANADAIVRTVHCTKKTVRDLSGTVIDFQKLELIGDGPRNIPNDLAQKLQVWKKFRESECSATGIIECLKLWVRGWDPAKWNGMLNVECVRDSTIDFIRMVMKGFMGAARALSCEPEHEKKWLEMETRVLLDLPPQHTPGPQINTLVPLPSTATSRQSNALSAMATSKKRKNRESSKVDDLKAGVTALIEQAVSSLQDDVETERLQKVKLIRDVRRLQAEKERLMAAAASDKRAFDKEKAELLQSIEKERAQMSREYNKYTAEMVWKVNAEKTRLRKKIDEEKEQLEAAARDKVRACHMCMEKPHNVMVFPCSHAHYCEDCVDTFLKSSNTCPTCKVVVTGTIRCII